MKTLLALVAALLAGPASSAPATPADRPDSVPAAVGEVTTSVPVTVLDDGGGAELCLGGVFQSLPPQCDGPAVAGWDWVEHAGDFEEVRGVRWGAFVVSGAFDGSTFTPSEVVPAAEQRGPGECGVDEHPDTGAVSADDLARIQREVNELPGMLMSARAADHVDLTVVHDDGTIQAWVDQEYGEGMVAVSSALVPLA